MKKRRTKTLVSADTLVLLKRIGGGLLVISTFGLVVVGIWYGTRLPAFTIAQVSVEGGETISPQIVQKKVEEGLAGNYFALVPHRFSPWYPAEKISQSVKGITRVKDVSFDLSDKTHLRVHFTEYVPHALWCENKVDGPCLFLDEEGYGFAPAPMLLGDTFLRLVTTNRVPKIGENVLDKPAYSTLFQLQTLLKQAQGWTVTLMEVDEAGDVYVSLEQGGELKVSSALSPEKTVENLITVLNAPELEDLQTKGFQYIDLRFGDKVFVQNTVASTTEAVLAAPVLPEAATSSASSSEEVSH